MKWHQTSFIFWILISLQFIWISTSGMVIRGVTYWRVSYCTCPLNPLPGKLIRLPSFKVFWSQSYWNSGFLLRFFLKEDKILNKVNVISCSLTQTVDHECQLKFESSQKIIFGEDFKKAVTGLRAHQLM